MMNWTKFLTYGDSLQNSFETLSTQLFERFMRRQHGEQLTKFRVITNNNGCAKIKL
jgi:hypothetical protein